jgi:outer membrane protein OmpA-like peptidoglycan-associated protein
MAQRHADVKGIRCSFSVVRSALFVVRASAYRHCLLPLLFLSQVQGQNLGPNPGFEKYFDKTHCKYWTEAQYDFNHFYNRTTHEKFGGAANGDGYHCLCMYGMEENEFMHVALTDGLEKGKLYKLSMNVRLSVPEDEVFKQDGLPLFKRLDWYFTSIPINVLKKLFITAEPSATFPFATPHPREWTTITTEYVAQGDEQFLTIGNITRMYEKIKYDEEVDSLQNAYDNLAAREKRETDSVAAAIKAENPIEPFDNSMIYSMNSLVEKKKIKRKDKKKYERFMEQQAILGRKIAVSQEPIHRKYVSQKHSIVKRMEAKKKSYAVNVCFDDIVVEEIKGERREIVSGIEALVPEEGKTIILKNVNFATNKFDINQESEKQLNQLLEWMKKNEKTRIQVSGHTDNVGSKESNQTLSMNRAKAVTQYLIDNGIDKSRIRYRGYGSNYALADNTNEMGRAMNRRVEVTIIGY